ncbi:hypothetical protein IGI37_003827 [Enterococcus sp. AZ194]|uniref:hypothetical protein n=1 Tax=Enterococcus sp. AZ194 TaxID=2774629 RepID=UPI003F289880
MDVNGRNFIGTLLFVACTKILSDVGIQRGAVYFEGTAFLGTYKSNFLVSAGIVYLMIPSVQLFVGISLGRVLLTDLLSAIVLKNE